MKKFSTYVIVGLALLALTGCQGQAKTSTSTDTTTSEVGQGPLEKLAPTENLDWRMDFNKIQLASAADNFQGGSSLEELTSLFGETTNHEERPAGDVTLDLYSWQRDNSTITVQFFDNSAVSRAISNFSFSRQATIDKSRYDQLELGMDFTKVVEELGEPDLISESVSSDKEDLQAVWTSGLKTEQDNAAIELTFENKALKTKQQTGL